MTEMRNSIRLCAAGDVALGGILEGRLDTPEDREKVIRGVMPFFARGDIRLLDLDCTFDTGGTPPHPDEYLVWAFPGQLALLQDLRLDIVSLANNHSMDFGGDSLAATQEHLRERGIAWVGAGADLSVARKPHIAELDGIRVGFLGYASTHPWVGAVAAGSGKHGVAPLEPEIMQEDVESLRKKVDCVVVSLHWGKEYLHYPPPENIDLGHRLVEWGAKLILGHHPHVLQGIERYRDGIICYSLGNFLFPDYLEQRLHFKGEQNLSLLALFRLDKEGVELEALQLASRGESGDLELLKGDREEQEEERLDRYSAVLGREDYRDCWSAQVRRYEARRLWRVFEEEVIKAGWRGGTVRLLRLGVKNFRSVGRSLAEILTGAGKNRI